MQGRSFEIHDLKSASLSRSNIPMTRIPSTASNFFRPWSATRVDFSVTPRLEQDIGFLEKGLPLFVIEIILVVLIGGVAKIGIVEDLEVASQVPISFLTRIEYEIIRPIHSPTNLLVRVKSSTIFKIHM